MQNNFYFKSNFTNIYKKPSISSEVTSQIIYGEKFKILSKNKGWLKIRVSTDNYVGYINNSCYTKKSKHDYKVINLRAQIFKKPNFRTNNWLPFGSRLSAIDKNKNFIKIEESKWIKKKDVKKINFKYQNFNKIFKKFLNVKYKWGGKTYAGIDCSALLQVFFNFNNLFYPRDSKDQIKFSKINLIKKKFKKGDIIFWKGHVAICLNSKNLIHAYGPKKKVIIMPIIKTINKIRKTAKLKIKKITKIKY